MVFTAPSPPPRLLPPQRRFSGEAISKLLCSAARLFVCWGKGAQQAEKRSVQKPPQLLAPHFGKVSSSDRLIGPSLAKCVITQLYVPCVLCSLLNHQTNKVSVSHVDSRGRRSGSFLSSLSVAERESYLKGGLQRKEALQVFQSVDTSG